MLLLTNQRQPQGKHHEMINSFAVVDWMEHHEWKQRKEDDKTTCHRLDTDHQKEQDCPWYVAEDGRHGISFICPDLQRTIKQQNM